MWHELKNQADIDKLMRVFGGFHDSCLKEAAIRNREFVSADLAMSFSNRSIVRLLFQRQFNNPMGIELQFEGVQDFNWTHFNASYDPGFSIIYQAVFFQQDTLFYWAEDLDWQLTAPDRNDFRWISAASVKWRVTTDAAGASDKLLSFE